MKDRIINDQNGSTGNSFMYGFFPAKWNGCKAIAVHNAKVLMGIESSLSETMTDFQSVGAMIGYGLFGSDPNLIGRVLEKEGIGYSRVTINEMTESGVYIMSYWNSSSIWDGLHTVAVYYDGSTYMAYNTQGSARKIEILDYSDRYICGYYLG